MELELDEEGRIAPYEVDERGRITVGKEFAGDTVRVALLGRLSESNSAVSQLPDFRGEESTRVEKQAAMLGSADQGSPYWFGFTEDGNEVGIGPGVHHRHVLVAGENERERTSALKDQWKQIVARGHGGILHLTNESARGFRESVREAGREDDLVVIDPQQPSPAGINVIGGESGEGGFVAAGETVAALLLGNMSSGAGSRAKKAIWNIIRETGGDATLKDVYYVLASETEGSYLSEAFPSQRSEWLNESVSETQLNDENRTMVMKHLQMWVENPIVREGIAATDPVVSIPEAVQNQKLIMVQSERSSGIPGSMVAMATFLRAFNTLNEQRTSYENPSPYYLVTDDLKTLSDTGPLSRMLPRLRSHKVSVIGAMKKLTEGKESEQLPIRQFGTFLTFCPRRSDVRACTDLHSTNIKQHDLFDLPEGTAYLRTSSGDQQLESVRVETFGEDVSESASPF